MVHIRCMCPVFFSGDKQNRTHIQINTELHAGSEQQFRHITCSYQFSNGPWDGHDKGSQELLSTCFDPTLPIQRWPVMGLEAFVLVWYQITIPVILLLKIGWRCFWITCPLPKPSTFLMLWWTQTQLSSDINLLYKSEKEHTGRLFVPSKHVMTCRR